MATASEIFRIVGKVVIEGVEDSEKLLTSLGKSATKLDDNMSKSFKSISKDVPKDITKPIDDSVDKTSKKLNSFEKEASGFTSFVKQGFGIGIGMKVIEGAIGIFGKIGGALKGATFDMNATLETTELQFTTLMDSAEDARKQVAFLFDFAKKTPFETGPIIQASKIMQTFGGSALNTEKNLTLIGDAAAATNAPIDELGMWTGRLYAALQAGKPFGDAAARLGELAVLSPQARQKLEDMQKAGKSGAEIFAAYQEELGKFSGAMDKQAGTWQGLTSTFSDTINILASKALKPFFDLAGKGLGKINEILGSDSFAKGAEKIATALSGFIGKAITNLVSLVQSAWPTIQKVFVTVRDSIITFIQALQGNWVDNKNVEGIHRFIGNIGLIIRNDVLPALGKFKDFLIGTVMPALGEFVSWAGPKIMAFAKFMWDNVVPALIDFGKQAITVFKDQILPAIQNFVAAVWPKLQQFAEWFSGTIIPAIKQFASDASNTWTNTIQPAIQNAINTILPVLQQFADWFITTAWPKIQEFVNNLVQAWQQIEPEVVGAIQAIVTNIQTVLGPIVEWIQAHGDQIKAILTGTWNTIIAVLQPILDGIKQTILLVLNLIQGDWSGAWENIKKLFSDILNAIYQMAKPLLDPLIQSFQNFTSMVGNFFSDLGTKVNQIWTTMITAVQTAWNALVAFLTPAINAFKAVWDGVWNVISTAWDTLWRAIATVVQVQWAIIKAFLEPALNAIKQVWDTTWNAIKQTFETIWNALKPILEPIFNGIKQFISDTLNSIKQTWSDIWNSVKDTAQTIWNGIKDTVTTIWNGIKDAAQTTWTAIKDFVVKPIQEAKDGVGNALDAIFSKAKEIWDKVQGVFNDAKDNIKNALQGPFESVRDAIGGVVRAIGNNIRGPIVTVVGVFEDFVNGVRGAINFVSDKLGLGQIISGTWQGARIRELAEGTRNWIGGTALIAEKGAEVARLPTGEVRVFKKPQLVDLPRGTVVWDANKTNQFIANTQGNNLTGLSYMPYYARYARGLGGITDWVAGKVSAAKNLGGDALSYARDIVGKGAEKVTTELMGKVNAPQFPGVMSAFGGKMLSLVKDKVIEAIKALLDMLKNNLPTEYTSWGGTVGPPGTINGVSGDKILAVAMKTVGSRGWCENFVARVMAAAGVRYRQGVADAYTHSLMQPTTPGTGPTGAPVYTLWTHPGDVAISMGNGMTYGTEGNGPLGAGPFHPYTGARYTLNPAANGLVINRPTGILAGENARSRPEIVTPERLMADTFRRELANSGLEGMTVVINVTANTEREGMLAGEAAGRSFRDKILSSGYNR